MRKYEKEERWKDETIKQYLKKAAEAEPIPESLQPKQMEVWLRKMVMEETTNKKKETEKISDKDKSEIQEISKKNKSEIQEISNKSKSEIQEISNKSKSEIQEISNKSKSETQEISKENKNEAQETFHKKKEGERMKKEERLEEVKREQKDLPEQGKRKAGKKTEKKYHKWYLGTTAAVACLAVILFATGKNIDWEKGIYPENTKNESNMAVNPKEEKGICNNTAPKEKEAKQGTTYQELYQSFSKVWKEESIKFEQQNKAEFVTDTATSGATRENTDSSGVTEEAGAEDDMAASGASNKEMSSENEKSADYGKTNQQESEVEEADIIKNDGRYLYQVMEQRGDYSIQIVDTKDGLKEVSNIKVVEGDSSVNDIYVWKDTLLILESGWARGGIEGEEGTEKETEGGINPLQGIKDFIEDVFVSDDMTSYTEIPVSDDMTSYTEIPYSKIHVYNIKDRSNPVEYHTFTIKGNYKDSRISDGYFYFFAQYNANKPNIERDYKAYIPQLEGEILSEDQIYLPEDADEAAYLVMTSINMEKPDEFTDTKAIVTSADKFYVSKENIYVSDSKYMQYGTKTEQSDSTRIFRFSYKDGKIQKEAEGSVQGTLTDDMAMNEYNGYLRMVTTVESQSMQEVKDDITGEVIGDSVVEHKTTNSLYVLDEKLEIIGKIENLAKEEQVYSARFMGDSGYFVTFRQVDPLFSVDLSNPREPKILGELKISGFSEYLHFYADNLLLGIGMEADENTGVTENIKLSMFDISNPADVKEQSKLDLEDYEYSEALYDYKSVLIDTDKNLFGFHAEGYGEEYKSSYLLFSFEDGAFKEIMSIDCSNQDIYSYHIRGTYIGNNFYLMCGKGRIEEYSLTDGSKIGELVHEMQE
ncbi:MAG: beta-propeller domain-containing protein [Lachnospiraceae bacterium]